MAEKIKIRISQKNDTTARWGSSSLVLNLGEIGIERKTDGTCAMKIGDGVKTWSQLPYLEANAADVPDWAKSDIPVDQSTGNGFIKTVTVSDNHVSFERANLAVSNGTAESGKYISEISSILKERIELIASIRVPSDSEAYKNRVDFFDKYEQVQKYISEESNSIYESVGNSEFLSAQMIPC